MIYLYPEQLYTQLQKELRTCYLLNGNEPLFLQESQDLIRQAAKQRYSEYYSIYLDAYTDWDIIFSICQKMSLFASSQILSLVLPEHGPNMVIEEHLLKLANLLHDEIILILRGPLLTTIQKNSPWFKIISLKAVCINCQGPQQNQLPYWVAKRAKTMNLELDNEANQLLCYCYEGNLLALSQALGRLALLYPDGKLTLPRVEQSVDDAAYFTPLHWIDAILTGDSKRTWHILQLLRQQEIKLTILIRILQRELLLLLTLKRGVASIPLCTLFDQHQVWQHRRNLIAKAVQHLSNKTLRQAVQRLVQIELAVKQHDIQLDWLSLEMISMFLCGKNLPTNFTYD
ncbi:DNA polymerase III, d subunit [Serratia symbiotica str. 'Cinara cedri']|nr:DNA polymerase III, d subunit [Serratia symbiotica str. 'Cinara cedri']